MMLIFLVFLEGLVLKIFNLQCSFPQDHGRTEFYTSRISVRSAIPA